MLQQIIQLINVAYKSVKLGRADVKLYATILEDTSHEQKYVISHYREIVYVRSTWIIKIVIGWAVRPFLGLWCLSLVLNNSGLSGRGRTRCRMRFRSLPFKRYRGRFRRSGRISGGRRDSNILCVRRSWICFLNSTKLPLICNGKTYFDLIYFLFPVTLVYSYDS